MLLLLKPEVAVLEHGPIGLARGQAFVLAHSACKHGHRQWAPGETVRVLAGGILFAIDAI